MTTNSSAENGGFEIRIKGHLSPRRLRWISGLTILPLPGGMTLLITRDGDQAALHGLLNALRDLGVTLVSILPAPKAQVPGDD